MELEAGSPGVGRRRLEGPSARERRRHALGRSGVRAAVPDATGSHQRIEAHHSRHVGDHVGEDAGRDDVAGRS